MRPLADFPSSGIPMVYERQYEHSFFADLFNCIPRSSRGSRKELAIRLTESAARRVAALTQGASGRLLFIEWEGKVLDRVLIAGPLARDIALSINSPVDVLVMSAALRGGALPDELHLISLK